ncbi:DUF885 domain-containing protein [Salinimonas iocasae]|uniref:DUF885 domain-containing protein n=1 Tax=Salinimonas iocasae TaxID=2572577 RepID=A0A5B7YEM0_9ALTE|nr:DUF885 domain-containing protein [Salinimonas iocasae]QCZ94114.1 DUF885 domain-containing protein [Salinimonas iocasae]
MKTQFKLGAIAFAVSTIMACSPAEENTQQTTAKAETTSEQSAQNTQSESERLNAFFERTFEEDLKRSPLYQSYLGYKWDYGEWDDFSEEANDEAVAIAKNRLEELENFDTEALSDKEKLSVQLYRYQLELNLKNDEFRHHSYVVNQFRGPHTMVPSFLINIHRVADKSDAQAYISRLDKVDDLFSQVIDQMNLREEAGVFPPDWSYDQMIQAAKNVTTGAPFDDSDKPSTIWEDINNKIDALDIKDTEKQNLREEAKAALLTSVKPAYNDLVAAFENQQKKTPEGDGVWRLPDGDKWYKNRLSHYTTTDLSADEIHQIGLDNVKRIHNQMKEIMKEVEFDGSLQEFFTFMRNDEQFYYENTQEGRDRYLKEAKAHIDEMRDALPEYFGLMPKADMIVKRVEEFREQSAGKAFYQSPSQDGSRPGTYYANLYDMKDMPTYQMEALAYHEGIPGHHMQRAIAQELEGVPMFQKFLSATAYTEGWGLYSEELAKDMGFYKDPYSDFGRLAMELWRACRLVVDTGIHDKEWSREEAIEYLKKNTPNPENDSVKAIERYIALPGQATAYMIGKLKIMELRDKAQQELGDKFTFAGFHDEVLKDGPVPLSVLEEKINTWIKDTKANQ